MTFDSHIFISYGHVDNIPTPGEDGWVTRFEKFLESYLSAEIGEAARIWRDDQLARNGVFSAEIEKQLARTAAVVTIVSKRYIDSDWCRREAETFLKAAEQSGGFLIDDHMRLFQIMLKPLKEEERRKLPSPLDRALGYPFYREAEGGRFERLDPSFGTSEPYKRGVAQLAADIGELIALLQERLPARASESRNRPVVYLAECGRDRVEVWERIRAELGAHAYPVVPEQPSLLSDVEGEYISEVSGLLSQSQLSIHLVGEYPGKTPDGPSRTPVVELQNRLAAAASAERGLARLIWMPDGTRSETWAFPGELQRNGELQRGADLITGGVEDLKSAVRAALARLEQPVAPPVAPSSSAGSATVYLVCVEEDVVEAVGPLAQFLEAHGITCEFPVFSGAPGDVRSANESIAARCDAVLLFCGGGEGAWVQAQHDAIARVQATRRERPMRGLFYYLSGPVTPDKQKLVWRKNAINGLNGFSSAAMEPFLRSLEEQQSAPGAEERV